MFIKDCPSNNSNQTLTEYSEWSIAAKSFYQVSCRDSCHESGEVRVADGNVDDGLVLSRRRLDGTASHDGSDGQLKLGEEHVVDNESIW